MAETIESLLKKSLEEQTYEITKISWDELKIAAQNFLKITNVIQISNLTQYDISNYILKNNKIPEYELTKKRLAKARAAKNFYKELFKFDDALTRYLGNLPKRAIYVVIDDRGNPHTYEMSLTELAELSQKKGRLGKSLPKKFLDSYSAIENEIDKNNSEELEHISQGAAAVQGTINRLNVFYNKLGENIQKQGGILMWKSGGRWNLAKVANQGVVSEAYANFLLTKHKTQKDYLYKIDKGENPYYSHSLIANFYRYLSTVTNMPAIVEEDIINEFAQYSVKSSRASLPSINQYLRTAQTIALYSGVLSPENLKKIIENTFSKDSKLAPFITSILEEDMTNSINSILEQAIPDVIKNKEKISQKNIHNVIKNIINENYYG